MKRQPNEPCQEMLTFPETNEISLFKSKKHKFSVSIGIYLRRMRPIFCALDTGGGLNLIRANVSYASWQDLIHQHDIREIQSAFDTKLVLSATITLHLWIGEFSTRVAFGVVDKQASPVLLRKTFIDRFMNSIHPAERKIVPTSLPR